MNRLSRASAGLKSWLGIRRYPIPHTRAGWGLVAAGASLAYVSLLLVRRALWSETDLSDLLTSTSESSSPRSTPTLDAQTGFQPVLPYARDHTHALLAFPATPTPLRSVSVPVRTRLGVSFRVGNMVFVAQEGRRFEAWLSSYLAQVVRYVPEGQAQAGHLGNGESEGGMESVEDEGRKSVDQMLEYHVSVRDRVFKIEDALFQEAMDQGWVPLHQARGPAQDHSLTEPIWGPSSESDGNGDGQDNNETSESESESESFTEILQTAGPATGYRRPLGYVVEIIEPETTDEVYQIVCVVVDYTAAFLRKITIEIRPDYDALLERRLFVNVAGLRAEWLPILSAYADSFVAQAAQLDADLIAAFHKQ